MHLAISKQSQARTLFILVVAEAIISLDFSLTSIALPSLMHSLDISPATAQWILTVDVIIYGGFMIVGGRFADNYGERHCLTIGLSLFLIGSLVNALTDSLAPLLGGRGLQGLGAAFTFPATIGLLAKTFEVGAPRFRALTISTAVQAVGVPLGTIVAGFLINRLGGNAAFFVNVPACILLLVLVRTGLPRNTRAERTKPLPIPSAIVLAVGMGLLIQSALAIVSSDVQTRTIAMYAFPASIAVLAGFVRIQQKSQNPLFPLSLFKIENLGIYILISSLVVVSAKGLIVLSNISFQDALGFSAGQASLALMPMSISAILLVFLTPFVSATLLRRPRASIIAAFAGLLAMHCALANMPAGFAAVALLIMLFLQPYIGITGVNIGIGEILARAPDGYQGIVAAMIYTTVQVVGGLGLALIISAKDRSPALAGTFEAFSPSFMVAAAAASFGAILVVIATKPFFWQLKSARGSTVSAS